MDEKEGRQDTYGHRYDRSHVAAGPEAAAATVPAGEGERSVPPEPPLADAPRPTPPSATIAESFLAGACYLLAALVAPLGLAGGLYMLGQAAARGVTGGDWLAVAFWILSGLSMAGLLASAGLLVSAAGTQRRRLRLLEQTVVALDGQVARTCRPDNPAPAIIAQLGDRLDRMNEAIEDVSSNSLLDESQRLAKRQRLAAQQRESAIESLRTEMAGGHWDRARGIIARLRVNSATPAEQDQVARLAEDFDRRRSQAEAEDVAVAQRQCEELMSALAWDRAVEVAVGLVGRHPDSTPAKSLLARVDRERKLAQEQQRAALCGQIQRHTSRREWNQAVTAARQLIEQFAGSIEAEAIRAQMDTLVSNAEIQQRQAMENAIKDLVKRQRFEEAVALAEELIATYPNSPQAAALRGEQLDRLRQKAQDERRTAGER